MDHNGETNHRSVRRLLTSRRFWRPVLSVVAGALGGYLYYHFVGCTSGTCVLTSSPVMSSVWGGMMGFFLMNSPCARGRC